MAQLVKYVVHEYHDAFEKNSDPRVEDWFLASSPWPTIFLSGLYVYFCKVSGPRFMKDKKPYDLNMIIFAFNLFQTIFSLWMFHGFLTSGWLFDYSFTCQRLSISYSPKAISMAEFSWWYFISKFVDFGDTIFFVLKKKDSHVSFLHVFHHSLMPFITWNVVKFGPGGHVTFGGLLNCFVHVLMYFYYAVACLGPKYRKYIWWKKYLTLIQIIQFTLIILHDSQVILGYCQDNVYLSSLSMGSCIMFFLLFVSFYMESYNKKLKSTPKKNGLKAH